jgi:rSAM-associated Gly-rich repeat protein
MKQDRPSLRALAALLPTGIVGLSMSLASADAKATAAAGSTPTTGTPESVSQRLEAIRNQVSVVVELPGRATQAGDLEDENVQLAWWGNGWRGGWRNGGWHNGGWGNGGWHNGGWGNGGWHNGGWGNGPGLIGGLLGGVLGGGWGNGWRNW